MGKTKEYQPASYNPRAIKNEALAGLKLSMYIFGDLSGFVVNDKTHNIICGHQRREAASGIDFSKVEWSEPYECELGEKGKRFKSIEYRGDVVLKGGARFIVRRVSWPLAFEKLANLTANNPHIMGTFTEDASALLNDIMNTTPQLYTDLQLDKLTDSILDSIENMELPESPLDAEPQIDRAEELREKWGVKSGDLWRLGEHRLLCGDSTKKEDVERVMKKEKATVMFSDPPYGVSIGAKNRFLNTFQRAGRCPEDIKDDNTDEESLRAMLLMAYTTAREVALADNCSVFTCAPQGGSLGLMMLTMLRDAGLPTRHVLMWVKNAPTFSLGRLDYEYQHEPILFSWTKTHKRIGKGKFHTSLWSVDKPRASKEHPTMKPIELPENAIANHSDRGDIVFDNFLGSGTTLIACENLGRKCRAIEISPAYVGVSLERFKTATGKTPIKLKTKTTNK